MPVLVDGHNVIGHSPDLSLADPQDETKLIARLHRHAALTGKQITVVFDPSPNAAPDLLGSSRDDRGKVKVIYAAAGQKADDVLRAIAAQTRDRQGLIVVTSDRALADFVRKCGVRVQTAQAFLAQMQTTAQAGARTSEKPQASAADVALWSQVFKEPPTKPAPPPPARPDPAELKRKRRMEALERQVRNAGKLR